jgi:lipoate-protein ligase A
MGAAWRLLVEDDGPGAWNMAVDEAMLEALRLGLAPPTLRLYRWARPTLSLGYAQAPAAIDLAAAAAAGVDVVRRPTGGRAVLHAGDFTYAVAASGLPPGVAASYRALAGGIIAALRALGLPAELAPGTLPPGRTAACFASATPADLVVAGRKVVGSAQVRRAGAVLQHGTLYLARPAALAARLLPDEGGAGVADLGELLGAAPAWADVRDAFAAGFAAAFGATLAPGGLTAWERDRAAARTSDFGIQST